ncbi:TIGR03620 family F420-dependent LLM class oxidoreductase [Mycolicibacterium parafortuitum]|uniref:Luciferase-like domain-containing protein n=1 Tax=Mycolicibacterium parafortuitum TaxID=39692 RepID=A0A375YCT8_MYCPF|nr:TIGR03620 family F420-dependent LLM class oxidoreductase [Mycolicibacterium parafortuitum]ORB27031.1 LLM class F420-dependent oxidoreductase [Mycolicibacterium parafortuitum]SRX78889.1 hypothetical protein [Rhodococcus jostii RHA1] [Mycolicibacterium parafortuitum]
MAPNPLGRFGFTIDVTADHLADASAIEGLGFGTLWVNGGQLDRLDRLTDLLAATHTVTVGSAIIPPDVYAATDVARLFTAAETLAPGRLMVGLGTSHRPHALTLMGEYLDALDAVPRERRLLAAFGDRALELARARCAGALPMLFTPALITRAREILGEDRVLAVGLFAVLSSDRHQARALAREPLSFLSTMPSYQRSFARQGFSVDDVDTVSDRLVDTLVACGTASEVAAHAERLLSAGADHVNLQVLGSGDLPTGRTAAALLAEALT